MPDAPLHSDRLTIERFSGDCADDDAFLLRLLNEPSFLRHIGDRGVRSLVAARQYLLMGPVASYERYGFGLNKIVLKATGQRLGVCGLIKRETLPDPDLGYALLPGFCGCGYAGEAAKAVLHDAQETLGITRILAITDPANTPSIHLLQKLGFVFENVVRLPPDHQPLQLFAVESKR